MDSFRLCQAEYGIDDSVAGARAWARIGQPRRLTIAGYVLACRRLGADGDSRLVGAGFGRVPPREWMGTGRRSYAAFRRYWAIAVERPDTIGSCYNESPEMALEAMLRGIRAHELRWLGSNAAKLSPCKRAFAARAAARASARCWTHAHDPAWVWPTQPATISLRLLVALGQLCPELQRVALDNAVLPPGARVLRLGDVDWTRVAQMQAALVADTSGRLRAALAFSRDRRGNVSRRFHALADTENESHAAEWLAPAFPRVSLDQAARLCSGETPVELSGGTLSKAEAHTWLQEAPAVEPRVWLQESLQQSLGFRCPPLRSVSVIRWLADVKRRGAWSALTKERTVHGPGGQVLTFRFLDRIDEIQDEDLVRGPSTSVDAAFEHAAQRAGSAWLEKARKDHRVLHSTPTWRLYPCMRWLVTRAALVAEGEALGHCVGGYDRAVEAGQSSILAIDVCGNRSTVEITSAGRVLQHRGPHNYDPHPLCQRALALFQRRNHLEAA